MRGAHRPLGTSASGVAFGSVPSFSSDEPLLARDPGPQRDVLTFTAGGEEYAVGIEAIREIIKLRPITEVPRVPAFIAGVISVRGLVMPVIDLRVRLRLSTPALSERARILVVTRPMVLTQDSLGQDGPPEPFGLIVDRVHHVVRLHEADIEPPPPSLLLGVESDFVFGIGRVQSVETEVQRTQGRSSGGGGTGGTGVLPRQRQMLILLDLSRVLTFEPVGHDKLAPSLSGPGQNRESRESRESREKP